MQITEHDIWTWFVYGHKDERERVLICTRIWEPTCYRVKQQFLVFPTFLLPHILWPIDVQWWSFFWVKYVLQHATVVLVTALLHYILWNHTWPRCLLPHGSFMKSQRLLSRCCINGTLFVNLRCHGTNPIHESSWHTMSTYSVVTARTSIHPHGLTTIILMVGIRTWSY